MRAFRQKQNQPQNEYPLALPVTTSELQRVIATTLSSVCSEQSEIRRCFRILRLMRARSRTDGAAGPIAEALQTKPSQASDSTVPIITHR
jgi:hypothetical protein